MKLSILGIAAGALWFSACAEDLPGIVPPGDQLYYPTGLASLQDGSGAPQYLAICNSNFDQRYNAGSIITLDYDQLFELTPPAGPAFIEAIPVKGFVRVQNFCGELVAGPYRAPGNTAPTDGEHRLFAAIRGRNRLTMVHEKDGALSCQTIASPVLGTDCSPSYSVRTNFGDPFAVAYAPNEEVAAVGHLLTQQNERAGDLITGIAHVTAKIFDDRIALEDGGDNPDTDDTVATLERFNNISGTNTMVFVPGAAIGSEFGSFLAGGRRVNLDTRTTAALVAFDIEKSADNTVSIDVNFNGLNLQDEAAVQEVRGIALTETATRAYVSVRFEGASQSVNSGLAVVSIAPPHTMRVLAATEAGDELGAPALIEETINGRAVRVVYVPDTRLDAIWVFDVSTDRPELISKIDGRAERTLADGRTILAHTLDAPAKIVFVSRNGRRLGFVSNFANSTLAVIDATNPLAPNTEVIARFGQALTPDGENEGDE